MAVPRGCPEQARCVCVCVCVWPHQPKLACSGSGLTLSRCGFLSLAVQRGRPGKRGGILGGAVGLSEREGAHEGAGLY